MQTSLPVLIVDDSPTVCLAIRRQLESLGFSDIDLAQDGQSALDCLHKKQYGLVLSDWEMQPMGGSAFLNALRRESKVPVILITATASRGTSWLAGADAYLAKPFSERDLETAIKRISIGQKRG